VTAGIILAQALFNSGKYVQTFPIFGVERRGAPVAAYVRMGDSEILQRYNVYKPDDVIVLDSALLDVVDVYDGWAPLNGFMLINDREREQNRGEHFVDAKEIAWKHGLGSKQSPVVNTIMVGAFLNLIGVNSKYGLDAVEMHVPAKVEANKEAFMDGYKSLGHQGGLI
jgi:pyruvate ferredoxin oxidoreductase gamma subunit/2-oxoisovalerate ferredoxin oxidoreductase gamma subunit